MKNRIILEMGVDAELTPSDIRVLALSVLSMSPDDLETDEERKSLNDLRDLFQMVDF